MSSYLTNIENDVKDVEIFSEKKLLHTDFYQFIMAMLAFTLIMSVYIFFKKRKRGKFLDLFENKIFLFLLTTICIFSFITLNKKGEDKETLRRKRATKNGLLGFLIALMSYLDLRAAQFFIIWVISYYLNM